MTTQVFSPVFQFHSHHIRTAIIDDQPWFVAKDVCAALNITWSGATNRAIPSAWRSMLKLNMEGLPSRTVSIISEPAVYKLAFRSNKPEADAFTNWVASEVLPSIRKEGRYETAPKETALPLPTRPSHGEVLNSLFRELNRHVDTAYATERRIYELLREVQSPAMKVYGSDKCTLAARSHETAESLWYAHSRTLEALQNNCRLMVMMAQG